MRLESHRSIVLPYILLSQWRYSLGRRIFLAWSSTTSMYVCTLRTIVNRLYTDVNHSSANPVAPPIFWHLTNTRIIGTDQLLLYYCITYTLKHYGWWSSGGLVVGVLGFQ